MVNKIAVMAVVALVAIPIGLGYALNFQDVETTRYEAGNTTNVTQLLQNTQIYDYMDANSYQLNGAQFSVGIDRDPTYSILSSSYPHYVNQSGTASGSLRMITLTNIWPVMPNNEVNVLYWNLTTNIQPDVATIQNVLTINVVPTSGSSIMTETFRNVAWISMVPGSYHEYTLNNTTYRTYDYEIGTIAYTTGRYAIYSMTRVVNGTWSSTGTADGNMVQFVRSTSDTRDRYPVIADGFYIDGATQVSPTYNTWVSPGTGVKNILLTVDLSQVTGSASILQRYDTTYGIEHLHNAVTLTNTGPTHQIAGQDVIYEDGQPNIYQIRLGDKGVTIRYIGTQWPPNFGEANYYRQWYVAYTDLPEAYLYEWWYPKTSRYEVQVTAHEYTTDEFIRCLAFTYAPDTSGITTWQPFKIGQMRIDAAYARSTAYPVIQDNEYNPAQTIGNTQTTTSVKDIARYGDSITFGGNTYTVTKGNITMPSGRQLAVNKAAFESVYDEDTRQYENRLSGAVISTSATPSTITFNGTWDANITSSPLTAHTSTEQKWIAGGWAWHGVGVSFGMVGLVACVGVFIALGMYGRRSGAKVGALMLVCAGGALIFLSLL